jgi:hypothetical protein
MSASTLGHAGSAGRQAPHPLCDGLGPLGQTRLLQRSVLLLGGLLQALQLALQVGPARARIRIRVAAARHARHQPLVLGGRAGGEPQREAVQPAAADRLLHVLERRLAVQLPEVARPDRVANGQHLGGAGGGGGAQLRCCVNCRIRWSIAEVSWMKLQNGAALL